MTGTDPSEIIATCKFLLNYIEMYEDTYLAVRYLGAKFEAHSSEEIKKELEKLMKNARGAEKFGV